MWKIHINKRTQKEIKKLPQNIVELLETLLADLKQRGPVRGEWLNYSKLTNGYHHCHLSYRYVAVWIVEDKELKLIGVTYVGSRENAPY